MKYIISIALILCMAHNMLSQQFIVADGAISVIENKARLFQLTYSKSLTAHIGLEGRFSYMSNLEVSGSAGVSFSYWETEFNSALIYTVQGPSKLRSLQGSLGINYGFAGFLLSGGAGIANSQIYDNTTTIYRSYDNNSVGGNGAYVNDIYGTYERNIAGETYLVVYNTLRYQFFLGDQFFITPFISIEHHLHSGETTVESVQFEGLSKVADKEEFIAFNQGSTNYIADRSLFFVGLGLAYQF